MHGPKIQTSKQQLLNWQQCIDFIDVILLLDVWIDTFQVWRYGKIDVLPKGKLTVNNIQDSETKLFHILLKECPPINEFDNLVQLLLGWLVSLCL